MTKDRLMELEPILKDEQFAKEIKNIDSAQELISAFAQHGVKITEDEIYEIGESFNSEHAGDELTETELSAVSGGFALSSLLIAGGVILVCYGVGYVAGRVLRKKSGICSK